MNKDIPRILFAGTGSGCGKTTVTCAVLQALVNRKLKVGAFKCGPDYIDPMFHKSITGNCCNLDLFFFGENTAKHLLAKNGGEKDISVIEGVMGFYDGLGLDSIEASACDLSQKTQTPVVLIVRATGASLSVLAMIEGFFNFLPNKIAGVILNQCSEHAYKALSSAIRARFGDRIIPLGFLPKIEDSVFKSRHLGLITAQEVDGLEQKLANLAQAAEKHIDLDSIMKIAQNAPQLKFNEVKMPHFDEVVRIAVARDKAFCFYYDDNLRLLKEMGAELIEFSPMSDKRLPEGINGLYLGGGYPELYAKTLSKNASMRESVKAALDSGLPCIAECGGFFYLTESVCDLPMVGAIKGKSFDTGKLTRFGYITLCANEDNILCRKGEKIAAHEFHHFDSEFCGDSFTAYKNSGRSWECVVADKRLFAGYPHIHFYSDLKFAENFYKACLEEKKKCLNLFPRKR